MKKRIAWSLTLVVVLALALFFPATASTAEAKDAKAQKFTASGPVYISGPYESWQKGPVQYAKNEPVDTLPPGLSSSWGAVNGGSLTSLHAGMITLNPRGTFHGVLKGTFVITASDGSLLRGKMKGTATGTWNPLDPLNSAGTYIEDRGTWESGEEGSGAFDDIEAEGTWVVRMDWDAVMATYVGTITISGSYSRDR